MMDLGWKALVVGFLCCLLAPASARGAEGGEAQSESDCLEIAYVLVDNQPKDPEYALAWRSTRDPLPRFGLAFAERAGWHVRAEGTVGALGHGLDEIVPSLKFAANAKQIRSALKERRSGLEELKSPVAGYSRVSFIRVDRRFWEGPPKEHCQIRAWPREGWSWTVVRLPAGSFNRSPGRLELHGDVTWFVGSLLNEPLMPEELARMRSDARYLALAVLAQAAEVHPDTLEPIDATALEELMVGSTSATGDRWEGLQSSLAEELKDMAQPRLRIEPELAFRLWMIENPLAWEMPLVIEVRAPPGLRDAEISRPSGLAMNQPAILGTIPPRGQRRLVVRLEQAEPVDARPGAIIVEIQLPDAEDGSPGAQRVADVQHSRRGSVHLLELIEKKGPAWWVRVPREVWLAGGAGFVAAFLLMIWFEYQRRVAVRRAKKLEGERRGGLDKEASRVGRELARSIGQTWDELAPSPPAAVLDLVDKAVEVHRGWWADFDRLKEELGEAQAEAGRANQRADVAQRKEEDTHRRLEEIAGKYVRLDEQTKELQALRAELAGVLGEELHSGWRNLMSGWEELAMTGLKAELLREDERTLTVGVSALPERIVRLSADRSRLDQRARSLQGLLHSALSGWRKAIGAAVEESPSEDHSVEAWRDKIDGLVRAERRRAESEAQREAVALRDVERGLEALAESLAELGRDDEYGVLLEGTYLAPRELAARLTEVLAGLREELADLRVRSKVPDPLPLLQLLVTGSNGAQLINVLRLEAFSALLLRNCGDPVGERLHREAAGFRASCQWLLAALRRLGVEYHDLRLLEAPPSGLPVRQRSGTVRILNNARMRVICRRRAESLSDPDAAVGDVAQWGIHSSLSPELECETEFWTCGGWSSV